MATDDQMAVVTLRRRPDFQRLRTNTDTAAAPLLAASIFLDVLNVFLFFLQIFSAEER